MNGGISVRKAPLYDTCLESLDTGWFSCAFESPSLCWDVCIFRKILWRLSGIYHLYASLAFKEGK